MIVTEDEALHSIINGCLLGESINKFACKVEPYAHGWKNVEDKIEYYSRKLEKFPLLRVLFIIDFDQSNKRFDSFVSNFKPNLQDRMFLLGPWKDAEALKECLGVSPFEELGKKLAEECQQDTAPDNSWTCEQLKHNSVEFERFKRLVGHFLHQPN